MGMVRGAVRRKERIDVEGRRGEGEREGEIEIEEEM